MNSADFLILIADLNPHVRELLTREFSRGGYRVRSARDGEELCAELSRGEAVHLLLLDPELPYLGSGPTLARFQRLAAALPLVLHVCSGEDADSPLGGPAAAVVEKGGDPERLLATVKQVLGSRY